MDIKVGGAWKSGTPHIKVGGVWKEGIAAWTKVAGRWRKMEYSKVFFNLLSNILTQVTLRGPSGQPSTQQDISYYKTVMDLMFKPDSTAPGLTTNTFNADTLRYGTYLDQTVSPKRGYFYVELGFSSTTARNAFLAEHPLRSSLPVRMSHTLKLENAQDNEILQDGVITYTVQESKDKKIYRHSGDTRGTTYHTVTMRSATTNVSSTDRSRLGINMYRTALMTYKAETAKTGLLSINRKLILGE